MITKARYLEEHINCQNYDNKDAPILKLIKLSRGEVYLFQSHQTAIALVLKGSIKYSYGSYASVNTKANEIFLVPLESNMEMIVDEDCELLYLQVDSNKKFCDCFSLNHLPKTKNNNRTMPYHLAINTIMRSYADLQKIYYQSNLRCIYFHKIKVEEFFYILRLYYEKTELALFFHPIMSNDISFSNMVTHAAEKALTVGDLAEMLDYSISGFNKRFRKVFDMPPYKWLEEKRAQRIYKVISRSEEPFKSLISKIGFKYLSDLNVFCRKHYGMTPGEVRQNTRDKTLKDGDIFTIQT